MKHVHYIKKFYYYLKCCAIKDYLNSKGIILNRDIVNDSIFNPRIALTQEDINDDKRRKLDAWKHVKWTIFWAIPGVIIGLPLACCLIVFLSPIILILLVCIGIPIGIIWLVVYLILNW